mgnify:CR=1 FL=1
MTYENLLTAADQEGLLVKEQPLQMSDGLLINKRIAIRKNISTHTEKACVLAEELGHYYTTSGNILDQDEITNRKQELRARLWAYNHQIGLIGIIRAYEHGCRNASEMAEYLNVTEEFLQDALNCYRSKYGICVEFDNYIVFFIPALAVMKRVT